MNKKRYIPKKFLGGALLNVGMGLVQNHLNDRQERRLANQEMHQSRADNFDNTLVPTQQFTPTFQCGGKMKKKYGTGGQFEEYAGQTHSGPDEGIPVDETGSPTQQTGGQAVALTEDGEVRWNDYIFSNSLKLPGNKKRTFSDEAKRVKNKYKLRLGKDTDKHDPVSQDALERELDELMMIQETVKGNTVHQEDMEMALEQQAMEMQEMQGQQEQPMSPEEEMMMQEQGGMPMEQGMEQPMMKYGGKLKKYFGGGSGLGVDTSWTDQPVQALPWQATSPQNLNLSRGNMRMGNTDTPNLNNPEGLLSQGRGRTEMANAAGDIGGQAGGDAWMGGVNPLAAAIPMMGNLVGMATSRSRKPQSINLGRVRGQQLNTAPMQAQVRNQAASARGANQAAMQQSGATASNLMAGSLAGNTGVQRAAGEQLTGIGMQAEQFAAQSRGQADMTNLQARGQEAAFAAQQEAQRRSTTDQYRDSMFGVASQYFADDTQSRQNAAMLNMMSDNYMLQNDPKKKWWQSNRPLMRTRQTGSRTSTQ